MSGLDIHLPLSGFDTVTKPKYFNIIYPYEHSLIKQATVETLVRLVAWDDLVYGALMRNEPITQEHMVVRKFAHYQIGYLRDCSLKRVTPTEWRNNWGPNSLMEWVQNIRESSLERLVRVLVMEKPNYSLREFNQNYGNATA
jgi:hypothetical protein